MKSMKTLLLAMVGLTAIGMAGSALAQCPTDPAQSGGGAWSSKSVLSGNLAITSPGLASTNCTLQVSINQGATVAVDPTSKSLQDVQKELGMHEGFDVGLEMSGYPAAFREMLANLSHGAKVALLGIPSEEVAIDWNTVIFSGLTLKGIYGREMFETWYKMVAMLQGGLDLSPVITHRFPIREYQAAFDVMRSGRSGKVVLDWVKP